MFYPNVMASPEVILKNERAVCWSWVWRRCVMVGRARKGGGKGVWELLLILVALST